MDWNRIESNWSRFKASVKQEWDKLTDDQIERIGGKREQLVAKVKEIYGLTKEVAEEQISNWQGNPHRFDRPQAQKVVPKGVKGSRPPR
jgi:uncharacterized protein YjbJ (UPF0337 family)